MSINSKMTALADAIRDKSGRIDTLTIDEMTTAVQSIETGADTSDATATADEIFAGETAYTADGKVTGTFTIENELTTQNDLISQITTLVTTKAAPSGTSTNDATAEASDILSGKTAYAKGQKLTGTIATKTSSDLTASGATVTVPAGYYASNATKSVSTATQATPSISIDSAGKITASATQTAGYVSAGTKSGTKQMPTKAATTYTPTTSNQTIASGTYLTGTQTIKGDANLVAGNIKSGVSIFGVAGTYAGSGGSGGGTSLETCTITLNYVTSYTIALNSVCYTKAGINGPELVSLQIEKYENHTTTLENVICNTMIIVCIEEAIPVSEFSSNIVEVPDYYALSLGGGRVFVPVSSGSGTITITNDY